MDNGVMLTENALRCVAKDIELYYKKNAPNGAWCITTCRSAAAQFEKMRSELAELRRSQPENKPLTLDELRQMDGEPVYYAWDDIGWSKVVVIDGHPRIAATINHGRGYECALYTPTDIEGNSYAYRSKPGEK